MTMAAFTVAEPPISVRARASRGRWSLVAAGLFLVLVVGIALSQRASDYTALSTNNSTPTGTRALAQILRAHGVDVVQADTLARAAITSPSTTTLVIADAGLLSDAQAQSVAAYPGPIVALGASDTLLAALGVPLTTEAAFLPQTVAAQCDDPDATAAQRSRVEATALRPTGASNATLCFPERDGAYGFAAFVADGSRRTIIGNTQVATNAALVNDGNAALTLRTMGTQPNLVWYVATGLDPTLLPSHDGRPPSGVDINPDFLPPGFGSALFALGLTALAVALWRARRFGPLIVEPLPVVVRASEVTRGRARLYRRAHAYGRATAALRAAAARRMALRLGVPRSADAAALTTAIATASGRTEPEISRILYGPAPTDGAAMSDITQELDTLESEVHRP